jgi:hypothetical protein
VARSREWQEQVDRDRPSRHPSRGAYLAAQSGRVEDPDRAQTPRLGYRGRQLVRRDSAAHPRLGDRQLDADPFQQVGHDPWRSGAGA